MGKEQRHPIISGLLALVGVGLVVGVLIGLVVLGATRMLGLGGGDENDGGKQAASDEASMVVPSPQPTDTPTGPLVTLPPGESKDASGKAETKKQKKQEPKIQLRSGQAKVSPMQRIDLAGTYTQGGGAILQVQRQVGGSWEDFYSVDASVQDNGSFATYIETGRPGVQRFRMKDTSNGKTSNVVQVTVTGG
ncbi:hypothetical protein [Nocardioides insulae]|uniref:hypothetical protein n=1 Tax=Nocardioides insulae TaxID=394734 RepID=UPI000424A70A|nr:hypothetical protein [Nocardioides insulae]